MKIKMLKGGDLSSFSIELMARYSKRSVKWTPARLDLSSASNFSTASVLGFIPKAFINLGAAKEAEQLPAVAGRDLGRLQEADGAIHAGLTFHHLVVRVGLDPGRVAEVLGDVDQHRVTRARLV